MSQRSESISAVLEEPALEVEGDTGVGPIVN